MSAQHTPGPWVTNDLYADTEIRGPQNSGALICVMSPWGIAADEPNPQRANARLISAAPQLLTELQAAHRLLSLALGCMTTAGQARFARQAEIIGLGTDGASRHHERAAVIAKATGGAQ